MHCPNEIEIVNSSRIAKFGLGAKNRKERWMVLGHYFSGLIAINARFKYLNKPFPKAFCYPRTTFLRMSIHRFCFFKRRVLIFELSGLCKPRSWGTCVCLTSQGWLGESSFYSIRGADRRDSYKKQNAIKVDAPIKMQLHEGTWSVLKAQKPMIRMDLVPTNSPCKVGPPELIISTILKVRVFSFKEREQQHDSLCSTWHDVLALVRTWRQGCFFSWVEGKSFGRQQMFCELPSNIAKSLLPRWLCLKWSSLVVVLYERS